MSNPLDRPVHPIWSIPLAWPASGGVSGSRSVPRPLVSKLLGIGIIAAIAAPWLVHLVPVSDAPLGPVWLPIFYAPMLAALLLRLPLAAAVSVTAPIVSQQLTGMPPEAILPALMLQILCFVVAIRALRTLPWVVVVPVAYLIGLVSAAIVTEMLGVATIEVGSALHVGWPGVIVLAGLGLAADLLLRRTEH